MSILFKPIGYLAALAATAGVAGCGTEVKCQGGDMAAMATDERPAPLPCAPLKIPLPLDKAGARVDVTFEVPPPPKGRYAWNYFVGLRVLFTPGTSDVRIALENHPISARIFLYRIEKNGEEIPIPLFSSTKRRPAVGPLYLGDQAVELPDGVAFAAEAYTQFSGAPRGTPNASTIVLRLASAKIDGWPGVYRLQVETLEDIPALSSVTSFLVYEERFRS